MYKSKENHPELALLLLMEVAAGGSVLIDVFFQADEYRPIVYNHFRLIG